MGYEGLGNKSDIFLVTRARYEGKEEIECKNEGKICGKEGN